MMHTTQNLPLQHPSSLSLLLVSLLPSVSFSSVHLLFLQTILCLTLFSLIRHFLCRLLPLLSLVSELQQIHYKNLLK